MNANPLGRKTAYPSHYAPEALVALPRQEYRAKLGISGPATPFKGADIWNAYELSWLDTRGKPHAAVGRFLFPCDTPNLVESKSMKLYLGSLNLERYESGQQVAALIQADLSRAARGPVAVSAQPPGANRPGPVQHPVGLWLDDLALDVTSYEVDADLLAVEGESVVEEVLYTDLFRSLCPITGWPDWATVTVEYRGRRISHASLLRYLVSYRRHNDYHENCVERIFMDIMQRCSPLALRVKANFLRRGGIDINPVRGTFNAGDYMNHPRYPRQ